ncbi:unnamed protein product [Mytilus coruscus]|uniref:Uncharacterized protein n=1 Tax=Mytilus coruscus TaxID=42192 RepID=A0A6J8DTN3_MYTCO|nr:unnamed protein product [Mytilus coruscus]
MLQPLKVNFTNPATSTVTCYNITGEKVWQYNDETVLNGIRGVTTLQGDNVYVASYGNNSIVVMSPDGKYARRLVGEEDGLNQPHGIYLDKTRNNLLISCLMEKFICIRIWATWKRELIQRYSVLIQNFLVKLKILEELEINLSAIKKYAFDLQMFVGMEKVESDKEHGQKLMMSLLDDGSLQQIDIDFKMDSKILDILSIAEFGKISSITSSPSVAIKTNRGKQAQYLVAPSIGKTIDDINLFSYRKLKIPKCNACSRSTGCTITPTGQISFVD